MRGVPATTCNARLPHQPASAQQKKNRRRRQGHDTGSTPTPGRNSQRHGLGREDFEERAGSASGVSRLFACHIHLPVGIGEQRITESLFRNQVVQLVRNVSDFRKIIGPFLWGSQPEFDHPQPSA
jgi:hypothetical protein